jgi:anti-sigma regulatory factor (Ser/Thr protein kinase)
MLPIEYRFPAEIAQLRTIRSQVRELLEDKGFASQALNRVLLVLDEIVSNAIEHGEPYRVGKSELLVQLSLQGGDLVLDFFDMDVPEDLVKHLAQLLMASAGRPPDLEAERGRGLFLIDDAFDEVRIDVSPRGGMHLQGRLMRVFD